MCIRDSPSPDYTFSSTKAGTITYGGSCSSWTTSATSGNNTILFKPLSDGTYSDCTIIVTDSDGNTSNTLTITSFIVDTTTTTTDTTAPTVTSVSTTADNQSAVSTTDNITVTFSEAMDNTYVTTSTSDTNCAGTIRVSSDNFSNCVRMSSEPVSSNSNKTFTLDPYDNLTGSTTYKTRVTTGVKDAAGNALSSQYETSSGFITTSSSSSSSSSNTSGSGVFVAVGQSGTIIRSTDNGTTWDNATSPTKKSLSGIISGNYIFVVGGDDGIIVRSADNGSTFDNVTSSTTNYLYGVVFGNNTFVAVGDNGTIVKSTDNGSSFSSVTSPTINYLSGVVFENDTFVAVGNSGNIVRSTDNGTTWDNVTSPITNGYSMSFTKQLGTTSTDIGRGVAIDSSNNIYVTGYTEGGLDGNTHLGIEDIFLVKYNSSGTKQWTQQMGTYQWDVGNGVTVDSSNNIYVTGYTTRGLDGNTRFGSYDFFLVKYDSSGTKQWTRQLGSSGRDKGWGVAVDSSNNIYVTGNTQAELDGNTILGLNDIFLVKYDSSGTKQWTQQFGTTTYEYGIGVTVESSANI